MHFLTVSRFVLSLFICLWNSSCLPMEGAAATAAPKPGHNELNKCYTQARAQLVLTYFILLKEGQPSMPMLPFNHVTKSYDNLYADYDLDTGKYFEPHTRILECLYDLLYYAPKPSTADDLQQAVAQWSKAFRLTILLATLEVNNIATALCSSIEAGTLAIPDHDQRILTDVKKIYGGQRHHHFIQQIQDINFEERFGSTLNNIIGLFLAANKQLLAPLLTRVKDGDVTPPESTKKAKLEHYLEKTKSKNDSDYLLGWLNPLLIWIAAKNKTEHFERIYAHVTLSD